jgi:hypothetical protein
MSIDRHFNLRRPTIVLAAFAIRTSMSSIAVAIDPNP